MSSAKVERLAHANQVITEISARGHRFFYSRQKDQTAEMVIDYCGKVRIRDEYSGKDVLVLKRGAWTGFSNGGTLRTIVEGLAKYVRSGEPFYAGVFGDPESDRERGSHWGYSNEEMEELRLALVGNPAVYGVKTLEAEISQVIP